MKIIRYITAGICVALILTALYFIDFQQLFSRVNVPFFVVILVMILNILALLLPGRAKNRPKK
jgi:putative effector of murein hydrolase